MKRVTLHVMTNRKDVMTNARNYQNKHLQNIVSLQKENPFYKKPMRKHRISLYIDLLFCMVIMPLAIMLLPVDRWIVDNIAFFLTLIAYVYGLYFVYRWTRIPRLFIKRKYLQIILLLIILITITESFTYFPIPSERITGNTHQMEARFNMRKQTIWFFFLFVTGFSLAIELTFELFRQILSRQTIEAEKNKAELALYKAQINPHFLFNTLNTLYALVLCDSEYTESAFVKFSNILKYMYNQATAETIDLQSEIDYVSQYVDLQKLRLNQHTHVELSCNIGDCHLQIPPMILFTFIENAFKYGTSSDKDCTISIQITADKHKLFFQTKNQIMRKNENSAPAIGIQNCRKRLDLLYPERYSLNIEDNGYTYLLSLTILLQ